MRMGRFTWVPLLCAALASAGCAIGNTHTFNYLPKETSDVGRGTTVLVFAVKDERPYVVASEEPASFVGEQRGGFGNPFNVLTTDRRPFAEHVAETVERDLKAAGFKVLASDRMAEGTSPAASPSRGRAARSRS